MWIIDGVVDPQVRLRTGNPMESVGAQAQRLIRTYDPQFEHLRFRIPDRRGPRLNRLTGIRTADDGTPLLRLMDCPLEFFDLFDRLIVEE